MPRNPIKLAIPDEETKELKSIVKRDTIDVRTYLKAHILLMKKAGKSDEDIAVQLEISKGRVQRCLASYRKGGLKMVFSGISGRGRKKQISDDARAWVVNIACEKPKDCGYAAELWYPRLLRDYIRDHAEENGFQRLTTVSTSTIRKILEEADIKPHKVTYYCDKKDPNFESKMHDVLVAYKQLELFFDEDGNPLPEDAWEQRLHVISYDEKPGIQALDTVANDRPPVPNTKGKGTVQRDYEYKRLGTVSLLAGIDLQTGQCIPLISDTHKSSDFVNFLKKLDSLYPSGDKIRLILDNHSAHTSAETQTYLNTIPDRFEFVFTPTHGSWLNMIEGFFSKMTRQMLKGIRVSSKDELKERIYKYFDEVNEEPVPYKWKYRMDTIHLEDENLTQIVYEVVNRKTADKSLSEKRSVEPIKRRKKTEG